MASRVPRILVSSGFLLGNLACLALQASQGPTPVPPGSARPAASSRVQPGPESGFVRLRAPGLLWAMADLDGDHLPDLVIARGEGADQRLELHLSRHAPVIAPLGLLTRASDSFQLSFRDLDGDHDLDLVVTSGLGRHALSVWINNGEGEFSRGNLEIYPHINEAESAAFTASGRGVPEEPEPGSIWSPSWELAACGSVLAPPSICGIRIGRHASGFGRHSLLCRLGRAPPLTA